MSKGFGFVMDAMKRNKANRQLQKNKRDDRLQRVSSSSSNEEPIRYPSAAPDELDKIRAKAIREDTIALLKIGLMMVGFFIALFLIATFFV